MAAERERQGRRFQGGGNQRQQRPVDGETGQVGNVWIGERPSGEDFASWFTENVKIHEGLDHADYIGGVVLIEQTGKIKKTVQNDDQSGFLIKEFARLEYTPYAKVDVRMKYLWDLCEVKRNWLGVVEPAGVPRIDAQGLANMNLPEGFFRYQAQDSAGKWTPFVACSMRVAIYDRNACRIVEYVDPVTGEPKQKIMGVPIRVAAPATKVVPVIAWEKVDPFAMMKAETGAAGRALGMAGMLVIPGSGIATAEDVQEAEQLPGRAMTGTSAPETSDGALPEVEGAEEAQEPAAPPEPPADAPPADAPEEAKPPAESQEDLEAASDDRLRELVERDLLALREESPPQYDVMKAWWEEDRKLGELNRASIQALQQPMLRGVVRKVRKTLEEARQAGAKDAKDATASKEEAAEPAAESQPDAAPPAGASQ
jgi:hypothetical protein